MAAALLLLPIALLASDKKTASSPSNEMTPQTRLMIMRDLTAERVYVRTVFPRGERGLELKNGKLIPDGQTVARLVTENGFAARPGDRVVISNVIVKDKSIVVEINGGNKKKQKWYQHISVGANNQTVSPGGAQKSLEANGSVLILEFDNYIPEMTGDEVRAMLAPAFDFKALTEAEAYQRTLPPKVRDAIKNHEILVGMDRDMVVYAKGRAPKKVRDKDDNGVDYEEWIYGNPPEEVEFVRFEGPVVARLEIMTVDGQKIVRTKREVDLASVETDTEAKKAPPKPANAPTLRRPGEVDESSPNSKNMPQLPYPPPVDNTPTTPGPTNGPTHLQASGSGL
jgi:hypothetical protein